MQTIMFYDGGHSEPPAAITPCRVATMAARVVYIVLSGRDSATPAGNETLRLRAIRRGWLGRVPHTDFLVHSTETTLRRTSAIGFEGSIDGAIMFDALRAARAERGAADWYMIGDDDTHVDPAAVVAFATSASTRFVYGNLYHHVHRDQSVRPPPFVDARASNLSLGYRKELDGRRLRLEPWCPRAAPGSRFRLLSSWFTGGSGVLVPGGVAARLTAKASDVLAWAEVGKQCGRARLEPGLGP